MPTEPCPVIWARLSAQGRGPARTLDHATITDAAIALADAEGLDAVSMRKVAARIDRSTMALYRHIDSKDDLYELMYDAVLGELDLPAVLPAPASAPAPTDGWRTGLAALAGELRRLYHRHPWASRLGQRPTLGPNNVRLLDHSLACVDGLGLTVDGMLDVISTTLQFTQGFVQAELGRSQLQRQSGMDDEAYRRHAGPYVRQLLAEGRHPYLQRVVEEAEHDPDQDAVFARRLALVLDGIATTLTRPTLTRPTRSRHG